MHDFKMLIGGNLVAGDETLTVVNPATEEVLAECPKASVRQLELAIDAAEDAFPTWSRTPIGERQAAVTKLADEIEAKRDLFARTLTQEQGKPLTEAQGEVDMTLGFLRYFATQDLPMEVLQDDDAARIELHRRPLGVVGGITPWNFPLVLACWKIGHATLAGDTIVLKPAPTTPLTALLLGEACNEAYPAGVVNVIVDTNDLGPILTQHPKVAKISFTGSTATGKKVMASAASSLKRLTLELGGNDAAIVLDDVNPKEIAPTVFGSAFANSGQVCIAVKRLFVHDSIYDEMCDEIAHLAENAIQDDGLKQGTQLGPVQNKMQYDKLHGFLDSANKDGKVMTGGSPAGRDGYFIQPTIVRDIEEGSKLVDEEQFGPVLPIVKFSDKDNILERANNSEYGLGGSIWSKDIERAADMAREVRSGTVWVNKHLDLSPAIPFAGAKSSGLGVELGDEGLKEFTQAHVVNINKAPLGSA